VSDKRSTWRFPAVFWIANGAELFERAAYYGVFITLTLYLTREVGFTDIETGWVVAVFAAGLYLMPTFCGALADKLTFRTSLIIAFSLLALGYTCLGFWQLKSTALISLGMILMGGSFVKPVITGTTAMCSDEHNRARAFSIFYMMVNIGSFTGKTFAKPLRTELGLQYINYYSALMAVCALILIFFFYKNPDTEGEGKKISEIVRGLWTVVKNVRFMVLIFIVAGFWAIQGQLYATMPKYMLRMVGEGASPEWLANINPFVVVSCVVLVTHLVRTWKPMSSIGLALGLIPFTALVIALSPYLEARTGSEIALFGDVTIHPITVTAIVGIGLQGLSECFLSPKFLEFASRQAPPGEVGLYMGYSHLTTFFAWLFGFAISGYLLDAFCPDPKTVPPEMMATAYEHAHYIWYVYAAIGVTAFIAMLIFKKITDVIDGKKEEAR
jgi:dipeptide/tripeptide permease